MESLASVTGADVAASDDETGHVALGGDWDLEYEAGDVGADIAFGTQAQARFEGVLAAPVITDRETVDSDGDGEIDQVRITTDINLNATTSATSTSVSPATQSRATRPTSPTTTSSTSTSPRAVRPTRTRHPT